MIYFLSVISICSAWGVITAQNLTSLKRDNQSMAPFSSNLTLLALLPVSQLSAAVMRR